MYKELNKNEIQLFADKYFPIWEKDITSVSCIKYGDTTEYLINNHYLFVI